MGSSQAKLADDLIANAPVPVPLSIDMSEHEQGLLAKADKEKRFASLKSSYKPDEAHKNINLIEAIHNEDFNNANYIHVIGMPIQVLTQLEKAQKREALRYCFIEEKQMAFCLQDKMWTAWKCQKERDVYYHCISKKESDKDIMNDMRWKYTIGTFQGETMARGNIMKSIWKEYFPSRELPHQWVEGPF